MLIESKAFELSDINDIYYSIKFVVLTSGINYNKCKFSEEFINEIVKNKNDYIGIPLVCEQSKIENGSKSFGHALKKGKFGTQQIGSLVDYFSVQNENILELHAEARVFKRFPKTCEAVLEMFTNDELKFSCEVIVGEYERKQNHRIVIQSIENSLIGVAIVDTPAEPKSKAYMVAQALNEDLNIDDLGGDKVHQTFEDFFKGTNLHFESCELDIGQIQKKVYLKAMEQCGDEMYKYICTDFGINFMILQDYYEGDYYKIDYIVTFDDVEIGEMYKVAKNYMPISSDSTSIDDEEDDDIEESKCKENIEINKEDESMNLSELQAKLEISENEIIALKVTLAEKDTEISEKDIKINELSETVNTLSETVVVKDNEISELAGFKQELDKVNLEKAEVEKAERQVALKDKYSKLLSDEVLALPEIAEAIEVLNESVLQAKVVESALEKAEVSKAQKTDEVKEIVVASRITDDIVVGSSSVVSKYITIK